MEYVNFKTMYFDIINKIGLFMYDFSGFNINGGDFVNLVKK